MPDQVNLSPLSPQPLTGTNPMPVIPDVSDVPPMPTGTSSELPPIISPSTPPKKKGKILATIFGILLLVGAVGAGVLLVGQQQLINQKAAGCTENADCPAGKICKSGSCVAAECKENGDCPAGKICTNSSCVNAKCVGNTNNFCNGIIGCTANECHVGDCYKSGGCYVFHWWCQDVKPGGVGCDTSTGGSLVETGASAKFSKNCGTEQIDIYCPTCGCNSADGLDTGCWISERYNEPCEGGGGGSGAAARCVDVKAYDMNWVKLSQTQLSALTTGAEVYFASAGNPSDKIDRAKFTIKADGVATTTGEITDKKPGTDEFYYRYTIPEGKKSFVVTVRLHYKPKDIWF